VFQVNPVLAPNPPVQMPRKNIFRLQRKPPIADLDLALLKRGYSVVRGISCNQQFDFLAGATWESVFVYSSETKGESLRIFDKHEKYANGILRMEDDVLASVDDIGVLLSWRARRCEAVGKLQLSDGACAAIATPSSTLLHIGTANGRCAP